MRYVIKPMETEAEMDGKGYVHWQAWQEAYAGLLDPAYLQEKHTLEKCLHIAYKWPNQILIAKDGEKVIGFAGYGAYRDESLPHCGELFALYVLQEYQRQGVGSALITASANALFEYDRIALWVLKENRKAIAFYQKHGFSMDGCEQRLVLGVPVTECRMIRPHTVQNAVS